MSFKQTSNPIKCEWSESSYKCNFKGNKEYEGLQLCTEHYNEMKQISSLSPFEQAIEFHRDFVCVGQYTDGYYDGLPNKIYLYIKKERLHTIKQFKNIKDLKSLGMIDEIEYDVEISVNNPIWIYC